MSKRGRSSAAGAMLELWKPPPHAGDPVGCLATTFTFAPGLFDEQCLARFLEIESEPNREDLAFLLERESRLGGVYAGVLVDHTQAGVEHSLRWDVLPVRIPHRKQHAKVSILAWTSHVRVIVASANLTEQGYRSNYEVAVALELAPQAGNVDTLAEALDFCRALLRFVPGPEALPSLQRAVGFLTRVRQQTRTWKPEGRRGPVRQALVCTLPSVGRGTPARSSLDEALRICRTRGGSPAKVWVASPFFDDEDRAREVTAALCKSLARGSERGVWFCVPAIRDEAASVPRLAAPRALLDTPAGYGTDVSIELLPDLDPDRNARPWHAKMIAFRAESYAALMTGSSNFTTAGLGIRNRRNAEANLLTLVDYVEFGRDLGSLDAVWPEMEEVPAPETAEWDGRALDRDEEEQAASQPAPPGFLSAVFHAGTPCRVTLYLDADTLPESWSVMAGGRETAALLSSTEWENQGRSATVEVPWAAPQPPEKLLVRWAEFEAFLPLNVENPHQLPPPSQLEQMTADDMLGILAAADPSAAFRAWAKRHERSDVFDDDLDSASPVDLDPLRRFDLQATFLHRIRRRARVLGQMRANLQRPVWGRQALEWRLRGLVGVQAVADRLARDVAGTRGDPDEALLTLADFLIVLREVDYQPEHGALSAEEFHAAYTPFLRELARTLGRAVDQQSALLSAQPLAFWERVAKRCLA
jgi:hypothetical protein